MITSTEYCAGLMSKAFSALMKSLNTQTCARRMK